MTKAGGREYSRVVAKFLKSAAMAMETRSTASNSTPVVLRGDVKPPKYGDEYSEDASREFYSRYVEYEQRVKHANAGGAVQHQLLSMAELIPGHVQRVFARVEHKSTSITAKKLADAVKKHAGHVAGAEVVLSKASAAVAKAVAMHTSGSCMLARVEPIMSNLEKFFASHPNVEAIYRNEKGEYHPGPAEVISNALVDGLTPAKFGKR